MLPFRSYSPAPADLSLRDQKMARARLDVLDAFLSALSEKPADRIHIKELCRHALISEPSFYNYFPEKDHLFVFFIQLWSVDMALRTSTKKGLAGIRQIFRETARMNGRGTLLAEVIAFQARRSVPELLKANYLPLNQTEKLLVFGDVDFRDVSDRGLGDLLTEHLRHAVDARELPTGTDIKGTLLLLGSIFFGLPVALSAGDLAKSYDLALVSIFERIQ